MIKRIATILFGVALCTLGVFFFLAPERAGLIAQIFRFWPVFLILAGGVRVFGHLLDRQPRSPVGGSLLIGAGGILLAANLRGEASFLQIFGRYWFWLLLALIIGRVVRQYTHRAEDGPRPRAFGPIALALCLLIAGGGLLAHRAAASPQVWSSWSSPFNRLTSGRHEPGGSMIEILDQRPLALKPGAELLIGEIGGEVEISRGAGTLASAQLVKRIFAASEAEARRIAAGIHLRVEDRDQSTAISVERDGINEGVAIKLRLSLPTGVPVNLKPDDFR
jgi:hypothetical protein